MIRSLSYFFVLLTTYSFADSFANDPCFTNVNETDPPLPTPPPIKVNGKTYIIETSFLASWYRAEQFCRLHGMSLASINNQEENNKLGQAIAQFGLNPFRFWTSGNDLDIYASYVWQSTGSSFSFTSWRTNKPDHVVFQDETEHCIQIDNYEGVGGWNDCICSSPLFFICEY